MAEYKLATMYHFECPYCGGKAGALMDPPAFTHALPFCAQFAAIDGGDKESIFQFLEHVKANAARKGRVLQ